MTLSAQEAKNKGNTAFKAGQYAEAVGHYSAAIVADRTDFTLPLNRAAAYLKLAKNEDAERDCTRVLELSPGNAKALFRRGSARLALGKAQDAIRDFEASLKVEPTNEQVKEGLKQAQEALAKTTKSKKKKAESEQATKPDTPSHPVELLTRAREIVQNGSDTLLTPVSTRTLSPSSTPPAARPSSFKDAQKAREQAKPSRVNPAAAAVVTSTTPTPAPAPLPKQDLAPIEHQRPISLTEFVRRWNTAEHRLHTLRSIPPNSLPSMFGACLEPGMLMSIIDVLSTEPPLIARDYLSSLAQVSRFQTLVLFLSSEEKRRIRSVVASCSFPDNSVWHKV